MSHLVSCLCVLVLLFAVPSSCSIKIISAIDRAALSANSFIDKFYDPETNYLKDTFTFNQTSDKVLTGYWTFAQGFNAIVDNAYRIRNGKKSSFDRDFSTYINLISKLYEGQEEIGWDRPYIDDMNWMALTLFWAHDLTRNETFIARCLYLFSKIESNWDETCCGNVKGGLWWDDEHTQKATASNAGPSLLASLLYETSGNRKYLDFSIRVFNFWFDNMVNRTDYSLCDHISSNGIKQCGWRFTYNEGLMIGAATNLYKITNDPRYLEIAVRIARFMILNEVTNSTLGHTVLFDGNTCTGDCMQFKGIAFRYLAFLRSLLPSFDKDWKQIDDFLQFCVDSIWENAKTESLMLFATDWAGPAQPISSKFYQSQVNSAIMSLSLFVSQQLANK